MKTRILTTLLTFSVLAGNSYLTSYAAETDTAETEQVEISETEDNSEDVSDNSDELSEEYNDKDKDSSEKTDTEKEEDGVENEETSEDGEALEETESEEDEGFLRKTQSTLVTDPYAAGRKIDKDEVVTEYCVGPAYEGIYTSDDVKEYIFENYTDAQIYPDLDSFGNTYEVLAISAEASKMRDAMASRTETYAYSTTNTNIRGTINMAMDDTDETAPKYGDYIYGNLIGWSYSYKRSGSAYNVSVNFVYTNNAEQEKQVDQKAAQIVNSLGLKTGNKTDSEKVRLIHDYLCKNIRYVNDNTYLCHGTYAALVKGECVCQGYAVAFIRLTREAGVASKYIVGNEINHAWNIVKLGNADNTSKPWYNIDVTWDDPLPDGGNTVRSYKYYLKSNADFTGHPRNSEYNDDAYNKAHPMATVSFDKDKQVTPAPEPTPTPAPNPEPAPAPVQELKVDQPKDATYTGSAITPAVKVYSGNTLLVQGTDYTVTYKNNINAYNIASGASGFSKTAAPTVVVTGIGKYSGTVEKYFRILPKNIADSDVKVSAAGLTYTYNNKLHKATPSIKYGKITLKNNTDFTFSYPDTGTGAYRNPGQYRVVITAKAGGNYTGTRTVYETINKK